MKSAKLSWIIPWCVLFFGWRVVECTPPPPLPLPVSISQDLEIVTYHIQSLVISRYAVTTVTCRIRNPALDPQEATFGILLPVNAFISNLTIEAGGRNYSSLVREKEEARRTYEKAKFRGQNTAIVHQKERETSRFRVDVTVSEQDEVIFYLTYEELLERRLGVYSHKINVHPGYPVLDMLVDVTIHETRDISVLSVKKVPGGVSFRDAVTEWREGGKTARLQYDPDRELMPKDGVIHGQLEVHYDVQRALDAGDIQIEDGYFVHFFAPVDLQFTPKHITFLIDTSQSMEGYKLVQVKDALRQILTDLNPGDTFNIIHFSTETYKLGTMRYTGTAVRKAKKFIYSLRADGGTNINDGLRVSFEQENSMGSEGVRPHIIIMLTDGHPTVGITHSESILKNVREKNKEGASIFCLGFGRGADMELLERIAHQNQGTVRKIYEDVDAAEQLKGFYQELSTPLLLDVQFSYSVIPFGTELVVTGQTELDNLSGIKANITGQGRNGQFFMGVTGWNTVNPPDKHLLSHLHLAPTPKNFIERLWAFLKVKDLLNEVKGAKGSHEKASAERKALRIALEHHFVTPLTSLVVVQPDQENCKDYEDDEEEEEEATLDQTAVTKTDDNSSFSDSLDTQDSVVRTFDPASIQLKKQKLQMIFPSIQNQGTVRKIYEDVDAAEQLKGFYQELSTPLLLDVQFSYSDDAVQMNSLSSTHFYNYFQGTELVVTGQTELDNLSGIKANITGQGRNGQFFMGVTGWNTVNPPDKHLLSHLHLAPTPKNFIERLWAFLKVKDLLNEVKGAKGSHEKASAERKALRIALEHHFVTPLTSLVVVQPDQENCKDYEDDEEEEEEEEATLDQTAVTKTDDNSSFSDSLDTQDSVVRTFDPASIQVVSNDEEWHSMDYDQASQEKSHYAIGDLSGSCANYPSFSLIMISLAFLARIFSSQASDHRIYLPDK
ncbi:inter-alpha-trypsin inhibitor heavy chain H4-like [Penaeus japonicus]|uniref:inter-alpha-trypsin inhibitor heavy chain H4-like n=1 Tax=Penaeus japonicus TaxID=27405 RepID=UPI001C714DF0|nr:inter-alpha-trypsin inhibitor heavy chain H4-like [Penaeus japonicus]